jgi:RNA polymerase sigma-70 factor (ECF subfamily)
MQSADEFETIVREYYEPLFRFAMSLTRVESDAQDLTQQTFFVWATKGHQLRDRSKVKSWLYTTLHRAFLETRRKQDRMINEDLEAMFDQLPADSPELSNQIDSSQVLSALAKVDEVYQAALALFYLEDCSYSDIAAILDVRLGTVKSRIARGIAQLREIFTSEGGRSCADHDRICPMKEYTAADGNAFVSPPRHDPVPRSAETENERWDSSPILYWEPADAT